MADSMRQINFTNGIKAENIQHNFDYIEKEIARERLAISGHGIASGLNFKMDGFVLTVQAGSLVDNQGREVFFEESRIPIALPEMTTSTAGVYTVATGGVITLENEPYATTRKSPSAYALPSEYGVTIIDYSNSSRTLPIMKIENKQITTDARWSGQMVRLTYSYTNKRYDTVYIDEDQKIRVLQGMTSSSPSTTMPEKYSYILGLIEVDPFHVELDGKVAAKAKIKKDMKAFRNVYTDSNNRLYICGTAFENLQIIHMEQPENPLENQLWYDVVSNKLRVWKTIDGIDQWVNVNDTSIIPVQEYKIWTPEQMPAGRQIFIFHYNGDMNMRFVPKRNALELIIDQIPLHSDQFEELTIDDAMQDPVLKQLLITGYGYTQDQLEDLDENYENLGIGFRLATALDKNCYVEARVTQRVNENPLMRRFQRTATFVAEDSFEFTPANGKTVTVNAPYRIDEGQLEVFVDGRRLDTKTEIVQGVDLDTANRKKGAASRKFQFAKDIPSQSRVAYKITTNIFSYDHVEDILNGLGERMAAAETNVNAAVTAVVTFMQTANENLDNMQNAIEEVQQAVSEHGQFVKKTDRLTAENMPVSYETWIPKGLINISVQKTGTAFPVAGIAPEDFITVYDMQGIGGNSILRRGTDYDVTRDASSGNTYLNFLNAGAVENGHTLYITGIKFKA